MMKTKLATSTKFSKHKSWAAFESAKLKLAKCIYEYRILKNDYDKTFNSEYLINLRKQIFSKN